MQHYDMALEIARMFYTVPPPPPVAKIIRICDVECYRNYFLVKFYDRATKRFTSIDMHAGKALNIPAMLAYLRGATIITYNGIKYDMLMISAAATGRFNNDILKRLSDYIINTKPSPQPWMIAREWGFDILELDHIDLIEVAPGQASLKIRGGRLHCKKMQDLPIEPDAILTPGQMIDIDEYCGNDLVTTDDLYGALLDDIETREELSRQYGIDVRSKSDAQIAEAAFKKLLNLDGAGARELVLRANGMHPPGSSVFYTPAPFLRFQTPVLQEAFAMVQRLPFVIGTSGQPEMPKELNDFSISIGDSVYRLGIGGLHSSEQKTSHRAGNGTLLVDVDVVSYYPKIISILRMFPSQIGPAFLTIYDGWIEVRIEYKTAGNKKKAATFKIKINGTFGKTGSKYSILFSPEMMLRTTITGQFSLLMLIEMLHLSGIAVVSANTDGVVIKCRDDQAAARDAIVKHWESITGFETEANEYLALFSRDVNNYLAAKPAYTDKKGVFHPVEFKAKGTYADPGLAKNPSNIICVDAVKEFILNGTPLEQTIRRCDDIRKFVTVRAVQGGGEWVRDTIIADTVGQKRDYLNSVGWTEVRKGYWLGWQSEDCHEPIKADDAIRRLRDRILRKYLGKAVRWYYARGERGHIAYAKKGNLVARSEGARPIMELPDVLPPDIDYEWYVKEAQSLLVDLGIC